MHQRFGKEPFLIGHDLTDHALFALPRLVESSMTLPANCVEYNAGDLPVGQDPNSIPGNGLSPQETV
jgi:hypothetical protein